MLCLSVFEEQKERGSDDTKKEKSDARCHSSRCRGDGISHLRGEAESETGSDTIAILILYGTAAGGSRDLSVCMLQIMANGVV